MGKDKYQCLEDYFKWGSSSPKEIYILEKMEERGINYNVKAVRKDIEKFYNLRDRLTSNFQTAYLTEDVSYIDRLVAKRDMNETVEDYSKLILKLFNRKQYELNEKQYSNFSMYYPSPVFYENGNVLSLEDTQSFICEEGFNDKYLLNSEQGVYDCSGKVLDDNRKEFLKREYDRYFKGTNLFERHKEEIQGNETITEETHQNSYEDNQGAVEHLETTSESLITQNSLEDNSNLQSTNANFAYINKINQLPNEEDLFGQVQN